MMTKEYEATYTLGSCASTKDEFFPVIIEWEKFMVYGCYCIEMKRRTIITNTPCMTRKSAKQIAKGIIAGEVETIPHYHT